MDRISRYQIESRLGEGGIGIVYKAKDPVLDKFVAIKVLTGNLTADQQVRFQNEAKALAELKHPKIPDVFDFSIAEDGAPYMVMEFVDGRALDDIIKKFGALKPKDAINIACQLTEALEHAHDMGILHRDVKPSNIIITRGEEQVKLVDFGLAKIENALSQNQFKTKTGAVMGSPPYMSPEQVRSSSALDARSDIYSLGCVLYEMLTGKPPYLGETVIETATMHLDAPCPTLPDSIADEAAMPFLQYVIEQCLQKDAGDRFQNMEELRRALEDVPIADASESSDLATIYEVASDTKKFPYLYVALSIVFLFFAVVLARGVMTMPAPKQVKAPHTTDIHETLFPTINRMDTDEPWTVTGHDELRGTTATTDEDFKKVAGYHKEMVLCEQSGSVTGSGVRYLVGQKIKILKVYSPSLTDEAAQYFPKIKDMNFLQIGRSEKLTAKTYEALAATKIDNVKICGGITPPNLLSILSKIKTLKHISLVDQMRGSAKTDWPNLQKINLESIIIDKFDFTNDDIKYLVNRNGYSNLTLIHMRLNDSNWELLKDVPIGTLELSDTDITDQTLEKINKFTHLQRLLIVGCPNLTKGALMRAQKIHEVQTEYLDEIPPETLRRAI